MTSWLRNWINWATAIPGPRCSCPSWESGGGPYDCGPYRIREDNPDCAWHHPKPLEVTWTYE